jgi:DnaK suppressor protein
MLDIQKQKENLLKEKEMLIKELSGLGVYDDETKTFVGKHEDAIDSDDTNDIDEEGDIAEEYETNFATGEILKDRLIDVEDALQKIDNNTYGICEKTGKEIEEDRLIANPAARTCKEAME